MSGLGFTRARVIGVCAALLAGVVATAEAAPAPASVPGSAAAASLPEVEMVCRSGQTDINWASASGLQSALGVDSAVAKRVIGYRPYLAPRDLGVVEGIGPSKLASILASGKACATPTTTPPPSAEACQDASKVDLASATASELVQRLKISKPNADKIIAARPFAVLRHVTPERVPGVGKGTLDSVVAKSCLTPAPIRTATASFRWAYRGQATTVARDGFFLTTPSGVIDGTGAWLSITDVAVSPIPLSGPTADFHVWGPWADGVDRVEVGLPVDPALDALDTNWIPVVAHPILDDIELYFGNGVEVVGKTAFVDVTSLSSLVSTALHSLLFAIPGGAGLSMVLSSDLIEDLARAYTGTSGAASCNPSLSGPLLITSGTAIQQDDLLNRVPAPFCISQAQPPAPSSTRRWLFANNTGAVLNFDFQFAGAARPVEQQASGDILSDLVVGAGNAIDGSPYVAVPGGGVFIDVPEGTEDDFVSVSTDFDATKNFFVVRSIGSILPASEAQKLYNVLNDCGYNVAVSPSLGSALPCVLNVAITALDVLMRKAAEVGLLIVAFGTAIEDGVKVELNSPYSLFLTNAKQAASGSPPPFQNGSGSDPSAELTPAGRYIVKVPDSNESWVLDAAGVLHPILDTSTYYCNALVMKVRYYTPRSVVDAALPPGDPATCPPPGTPERRFDVTGESRIQDVILRRSNGEAWFVNSEGYRAQILSPESFNCFITNYLVWDQMSVGEVVEVPLTPFADVIPICLATGPLATDGL